MIDWNRVTELRSEVGSDTFDEVVALFLEEVDDTVAQMSSLAEPVVTQDQLHFLKGSALSLGFKAMAILCRDGEIQIRSGKNFDLPKLVETYQTSRSLFLADLPTRLNA